MGENDRTRRSDGSPSPAFDVTLPAEGADAGDPAASPALGRYVRGEPLGSGGMGVVYRARDPDLDRELAIKLVLPAISGRRAHERLLAEARAMAKLRHPNVVPVFDVGITEQGVYVVMPLVPGGTLHDWLAAEPRPWRDVVDRFIAAGRGLAAAHAVGIVHRDFKPRNVLLDENGTVLVADFGLANAAVAPNAVSSDAVVTSVVGTPAYMAPEQAAGTAVDARADQYSFCISFWEGLHGRRPTAEETARGGPSGDSAMSEPDVTSVDLARAAGTITDRVPPPTWLQLAIARGFSKDPARRWPSMHALLDEIEARVRDPRPGRRRAAPWIAAGAAGVGGLAIAALALRGETRGGSERATAPMVEAPRSTQLVVGPPRRVSDTGGGCVYAPVFLDDDTIAFDLTKDDAVDVYTLELASGALTRVTDAPTWEWRSGRGATPDEVLYLVTDLKAIERSYVAARDRSSGIERRIADGSGAAVTFSGGAYYYIRTDGRELRVLRDGVDDRVLTFRDIERTQALAASPDGELLAVTGRIASASYGVCLVDIERRTVSCPETLEMATGSRVEFGSRGDLYLAGLDGIHVRDRSGEERPVVLGVRAFGGVTVAPGGKKLAFSECTAYGAVRELGPGPARLLSEEDRLGDPLAGPGGRVAWMRGRREIFVRAADGKVRNLLGAGRRGEVLRHPAFDFTGELIAFARSGVTQGIWVAEVDRAAPERQITYGQSDFLPVFLRDGSIVFARMIDDVPRLFRVVPGQEPALALDRPRQAIDVDRRTGRVLLRSPDQKYLYWWDPESGKETPGPPTYAPGTQNTFDLSISPDGSWLLYQSGPLGHELWRTPLASWKPELVFRAPESSTLETTAITDDGHALVIEKVWHGDLYVVDAVEGTL